MSRAANKLSKLEHDEFNELGTTIKNIAQIQRTTIKITKEHTYDVINYAIIFYEGIRAIKKIQPS